MAENRGKVFNIKHVDFIIEKIHPEPVTGDTTNWENIWEGTAPGQFIVEGMAPDGFGITPTAESEIIDGLTGEHGFSIDPRDGAEITLTLKSTSDDVPKMIALFKDQKEGNLPPFAVRIKVGDEYGHGSPSSGAYGFKQIVVDKVMLVNFAPFETDERNAPDYEFEMIGYEWDIEHWDVKFSVE